MGIDSVLEPLVKLQFLHFHLGLILQPWLLLDFAQAHAGLLHQVSTNGHSQGAVPVNRRRRERSTWTDRNRVIIWLEAECCVAGQVI